MSSCLYECLKEAGLERYYSAVKRHGFDTAFSLLYLRPAELQGLGITTDSDRQRFLQLVQIIASFHQGGDLSPRRIASPIRNSDDINNSEHKLMKAFDTRGYQSSDSSVSSDSSAGYILSPRRSARSMKSSACMRHSQQTREIVVECPMSDGHANESVKTNLNSNNRKTGFLSNNQRIIPPRHRDLQAPKSNSVSDRNNNVRQNKKINTAEQRHYAEGSHFPMQVEESDDIPISHRHNQITNNSSIKVQKVMHNQYHYGLPRGGQDKDDDSGSTPRHSAKTPASNPNSQSPAVELSCRNPLSSDCLTPRNQRRITVCVRKRPLVSQEQRSEGVDVITTNEEDGGLVVHELKHTVDMSEFVQQNIFQFDKVYAEHATNQEVYTGVVKPLVDWIMTKNNRATCFGYGQTGAGKTHTLLGDENEPGVFFHAANDVLLRLSARGSSKSEFKLSISLYEIYCSRIFDLLNDHKKLQALEDSNKQIQIHGLKLVPVESMKALLQVLNRGLSTRSVGVTGANQDSSRSHAIVQLTVRDINDMEYSRLSFIDLAGSERACDALRDSDKQNRLEGAEINQSLLALKECIRSLDLALAHTPFRQSKLTQVLRDSFIGNSKTCMIANISPCHLSLEHTMNTLRYASRVKELHSKPGTATPKRRKRFAINSALRVKQDATRRPFTSNSVMHRKSRSPNVGLHSTPFTRSVSVESGMKVTDYTIFTGNGRQLSRTPPPIDNAWQVDRIKKPSNSGSGYQLGRKPVADDKETCLENEPYYHSRTVDEQSTSTGEKVKQLATKKDAITTPVAIAGSSTPNEGGKRNDGTEILADGQTSNIKLQLLQNKGTAVNKTTDSNVSDMATIIPDKSGDLREPTYGNTSHEQEKSNRETDQKVKTDIKSPCPEIKLLNDNSSANNGPDSSSGMAEIGFFRESQSSNSNKDNEENNASVREMKKQELNSAVNHEITNINISPRESLVKGGCSGPSSVIPDNHGEYLIPKGKMNTGLPSPQKFLSYLKDKHNFEAGQLKQQLRRARRRKKRDISDTEACEDETPSSDHSSSSSSSYNSLISSVQLQHHQRLFSKYEGVQHPGQVPETNIPATYLPSPKPDQTQPRRSSRVSHKSSSHSSSPGDSPATVTAVTSASELHARLSATELHTSSDSAENNSISEKPLPSSSINEALREGRTTSSDIGSSKSSKKNSRKMSEQDETIHRAQSEVVIAHQEHISEILRISIEEERLYHELRDQWRHGTSFEMYTKSLNQLLARKTESIEALKVQLALYHRCCSTSG